MSAICPIVREGFGDYLADRLPAPQRRILREHLAACEACREAAASRDASLLLARPFGAEEEVSAETSASILASVRAGVAHIETERRIRGERPVKRRAAVAAAAAVLALLAVTVPSGRRAERLAAHPPAPPVPTRVAEAMPAEGLADVALPDETASPSNATVYELNPGAGREEPRVVWIVDRGLDI
jgi:anti-sigma factor RsiW